MSPKRVSSTHLHCPCLTPYVAIFTLAPKRSDICPLGTDLCVYTSIQCAPLPIYADIDRLAYIVSLSLTLLNLHVNPRVCQPYLTCMKICVSVDASRAPAQQRPPRPVHLTIGVTPLDTVIWRYLYLHLPLIPRCGDEHPHPDPNGSYTIGPIYRMCTVYTCQYYLPSNPN